MAQAPAESEQLSAELTRIHNNRFKVRRLLQSLEDANHANQRRSQPVQLTPISLSYYSPEKEKLAAKDPHPWRYYSNSREPVELLHPVQKHSEERFVLERQKVRRQSLDRRYEPSLSPDHEATNPQPYYSPRLHKRIQSLEKEQLEMRYVPSKFGRIGLDDQVDKFAYWDPYKRQQLPKQFTVALPHRITDSKLDSLVNYEKYHSQHSHHTSRLAT